MLKLKFQYLGHLMQRADSFEKTLVLGKIARSNTTASAPRNGPRNGAAQSRGASASSNPPRLSTTFASHTRAARGATSTSQTWSFTTTALSSRTTQFRGGASCAASSRTARLSRSTRRFRRRSAGTHTSRRPLRKMQNFRNIYTKILTPANYQQIRKPHKHNQKKMFIFNL